MMIRNQFSKSPSYLQSISGLRRLHEHTAVGEDNSPEADAIRDGLDGRWYELSETEQKRIDGLSEDLYTITDQPGPLDTPYEPLPPNPQAQRKLDEAQAAERLGKWDIALELLRRWGKHIDPARLSFLRGTIWRNAGDNETAILFFEHASRLAPQFYKSIYLFYLWETDHEAAIVLARTVIAAESENTPDTVVTAAGLLLDSARNRFDTEANSLFSQLIPPLESSIERARRGENEFPARADDLEIEALLRLAGCYERLGNPAVALRHINLAVSLDPFNPLALMIRGIHRYDRETGARDDFLKAIQLGSPYVFPAFYLAHDALVAGRFEDCLKHCREGFAFPALPEVQAMLHEWLAISRAELSYPEDQVRSEFEEALRLAPDLDRIRQNFDLFEEYLANPTGPRPSWLKPKASAVQSLGRSSIRIPPPSLLPAA